MIGFILKKIIGSKNDRTVKRLRLRVADINRFEAELQNQPADALRQKTAAWKEELSKITDNEQLAQRLDELLPEAFAVVKNACRRLCGSDITVRGHPSESVARALAPRGVYVSHGDFYASTVARRLGLTEEGFVRAGCACYTTADEIARLVNGVRDLVTGAV